jgi:NAD(P)-dependent dehydrogenase (short-subunit alcohol dehydrogenase family)
MNRVKDKVAIVTGAGSGIGAACAAALAAEGAKVVFADINLESAQRQAAVSRAAGQDADGAAVDIGDEASIRHLIDFVIERYGALDILHNNAADTRLSSTRDAPVEQMDVAVWDDLMRINLRGTMLACKYAIPHLRARGGGSIINTASGAGHAGMLSHTAYGVSKAGIIMLTKYVATQHGKEGIRCNAISPGLILSPATQGNYAASGVGEMMLRHHLTPRLGKPEDIANAVLYLASDESTFVTGEILAVDGGALAHQPFYADSAKMSVARGQG